MTPQNHEYIFKEWLKSQTLWFWNFSFPITCWGHSSHWNTLLSCFLNWCLFHDFLLTVSPQSSQTLSWVSSSGSTSMLVTKSTLQMIYRNVHTNVNLACGNHEDSSVYHTYSINSSFFIPPTLQYSNDDIFRGKIPPSSCCPALSWFWDRVPLNPSSPDWPGGQREQGPGVVLHDPTYCEWE